MRLKIKLPYTKILIAENCLTAKSILNKEFLGVNNKYHNYDVKPFSISMICGGQKEGLYTIFKNDAHIFFNTSDNDVLDLLLENIIGKYEFEIVENKTRNGINTLKASNVRYYSKGKSHFITEENKHEFEEYATGKYGVDIKVLNINKIVDVKYKNGSAIPSTNLLISVEGDEPEVKKLFDLGIGSLTAQGFGFIDNCLKN